jgi:hypothetical protein
MFIAVLFLCVSGECGFAYEHINTFSKKADCQHAVRLLADSMQNSLPQANIVGACLHVKAESI